MPVLQIEIEDLETWPKNFKDLVQNNKKMIISYQRKMKDIHKLCREDETFTLRFSPPTNEYEDDYKNLVKKLDGILKVHNIIGYHCTRLTREEIEDIKTSGMKTLSEELIKKRLSDALDNKYITKDQYNYLNSSKYIEGNYKNANGNRTDMIFFCPNKSTLHKDPHGIYRFFKSWGGEALYWGHENDKNICETLQSIGTPCIIKCSVPFTESKLFCIRNSYSERFLSFFISNDIQYPEPSAECDMMIKRSLKTNEVINVIEFSNPLFKELTKYDSWCEECPIFIDSNFI